MVPITIVLEGRGGATAPNVSYAVAVDEFESWSSWVCWFLGSSTISSRSEVLRRFLVVAVAGVEVAVVGVKQGRKIRRRESILVMVFQRMMIKKV